jgi:hypothetical protein
MIARSLSVATFACRWRSLCGSVEIVDRFGGPYVMPYASRLILEWLNVGLWPKADVQHTRINVCLSGRSRRDADITECPLMTHMRHLPLAVSGDGSHLSCVDKPDPNADAGAQQVKPRKLLSAWS